MAPGSIVVCKKLPDTNSLYQLDWLPTMDEKTEYMLREVDQASNSPKNVLVTFEEGVIGRTETGEEIGFPIEYVIELLPADSVNIEIEELVLV